MRKAGDIFWLEFTKNKVGCGHGGCMTGSSAVNE